MKFHLLSVSVICLLLSTALGCSNGGITKPADDPNVLLFCSFEEERGPSLSGWVPDRAPSHVSFSRDVPPNGGRWSLSIDNTWKPSNMTVMRAVPALPGTTHYHFSFWAKARGVPERAMLGGQRGNIAILEPIGLKADSSWLPYSKLFTADGDTGISIVIGLSGSSTYESGTTYFDLVKLEKLD